MSVVRRSVIPNGAANPAPPNPTRHQLAVLGAIAKYPKGTRVTAKIIAIDLGVNENTAQQRLIRMERLGLVRRGGWEIAS